jgi:hypothetical protein
MSATASFTQRCGPCFHEHSNRVPAGIPPFLNHLPVRIRFGDGVASELPEVLRSYGADRVSVMIDVGLDEANAPIAQRIATV